MAGVAGTGRHIVAHVLRNKNGVEVHVLPVGCVIQRLIVPDKVGTPADVVLGFDDVEPYLDGTSPYFGAVVGRVANRIAGASFELDGLRYKLYANSGRASLHGGKVGFDKRVWAVTEAGDGEVQLTYTSPDGEEGYPGTLTASVTYTLTDGGDGVGTLRAVFEAATSAPTLVNLAQHSYWNLGGHASGSVLSHELTIHGDHFTPVDNELIPVGQITPVAGTPFDFTTPHQIGERIEDLPGPVPRGYDNNYVLFGLGEQAAAKTRLGAVSDTPQLAATLVDRSSGRAMDVRTTSPGMQCYSGNYLKGERGKGGAEYVQYGAVALETQNFPDAIHHANFPSPVMRPGDHYRHVVEYRFYNV